MSELVSIIVPVYKTERFLQRCVRSLVAQDHGALDIVLVDDGSPDRSGTLCDELAETDSRIQVVHKQNGGSSSARNAGLAVAKGEYICFVDSDDYVAKDYVSTLLGLLQKHGADLAKVDYVQVSGDEYVEPPTDAFETVYEGKDVERAYLELQVDSACVFLYRKSLIGDTRFPEGNTGEDILFNFAIFQKAQRFAYLPVNKYCYYQNPDSVSNGPLDRDYQSYLLFRQEIYEHYAAGDDGYLTQKAEALYARAAMGMMTRMGLYGAAPDVDEGAYRKMLSEVFSAHAKAFYRDKGIPISRKVAAMVAFGCYPALKVMRGLVR